MTTTNPENVTHKICTRCIIEREVHQFYKLGSVICKLCYNLKRRQKYKCDEKHREKLIRQASEFKHQKVILKQHIRNEEQQKIGLENKRCKYCDTVKPKERFRHNRLKCKHCERDEPIEKFKRSVRSRIYICLHKSKTKHSIEYLGCSSDHYFKWIFTYNNMFGLDNHGKEWHIDHVIPLSKFDLNNLDEQLIAFNWRNTMPLSATDNLSKNNKILKEQVITHYKKLKDYHTQNKLDLPQVYIDLFAKHLDAGSSLEPLLPLTYGNVREELG